MNDRVHYFRLVHVFRISKGTAPEYLSRNFTNVNKVHHHNTRGSVSDFFIPGTSLTSFGSKSFDAIGRKEWNALPSYLKQIENIDRFKSSLKNFLMEQY